MKLKNMWKRFWTLDVHNHEGFTLVELIIVIAILAILSTGAIAGYSVYVKQANMTADKALVAEVVNALTLYYYSSNEEAVGHIVLTVDDEADFEGSFVDNAMKAAFGDNWQAILKLKYASWAQEGGYGNVGGSVLAGVESEELTGTVTGLTKLASAIIGCNDSDKAINIISGMFGDAGADIAEELQQYKSDPNFSTIASNLLVKYFANDIGGYEVETDEEGNALQPEGMNPMSQVGMAYAMLFSMANSDSPYKDYAEDKLDAFNAALEKIAADEQNDNHTKVQAELIAAMMALYADDEVVGETEDGEDMTFGDAFVAYNRGNGGSEMAAVFEAMGLVDSISNGFTDEALRNPEMFNTSSMVDLLELYKLAATSNGIIISIDHGVISVIPEIN